MAKLLPLIAFVCLLAACSNPYPGFDQVEDQVYARLARFGEGEPMLGNADYALLRITYRQAGAADSARDFDMYIGELKVKGDTGNAIDSSLFRHLVGMRTGEMREFIAPYSFFRNTFLDAYQNNFFRPEIMAEIGIEVVKTFTQQSFTNYVMNAAQHGEMSETEAIDLLFLNAADSAEWHGKVALVPILRTQGDTIKAGRDVTIEYNTYLLNGNRLDSLTTLTFNFGKPGQLIPGLSYALSLLREGEHARIYMPSFLAFGEEGSTTGLVPRNTPIYFDLKVKEVLRPGESPL